MAPATRGRTSGTPTTSAGGWQFEAVAPGSRHEGNRCDCARQCLTCGGAAIGDRVSVLGGRAAAGASLHLDGGTRRRCRCRHALLDFCRSGRRSPVRIAA